MRAGSAGLAGWLAGLSLGSPSRRLSFTCIELYRDTVTCIELYRDTVTCIELFLPRACLSGLAFAPPRALSLSIFKHHRRHRHPHGSMHYRDCEGEHLSHLSHLSAAALLHHLPSFVPCGNERAARRSYRALACCHLIINLRHSSLELSLELLCLLRLTAICLSIQLCGSAVCCHWSPQHYLRACFPFCFTVHKSYHACDLNTWTYSQAGPRLVAPCRPHGILTI